MNLSKKYKLIVIIFNLNGNEKKIEADGTKKRQEWGRDEPDRMKNVCFIQVLLLLFFYEMVSSAKDGCKNRKMNEHDKWNE